MFVLVGRNLTNMALLGIQYVEKRKLDTGIDAQKFSISVLSRYATVATIFNEYATICLAFIDMTFLIPIIHNTDSVGGLLQDSDLELASVTVVIRQWSSHRF